MGPQATQSSPTRAPPENQLVDTRSIGKPASFSGDVDAHGKSVDNMPWLSWSFTFRAYIGAVDQLGRRMLDEASKRSEKDEIIDHVTMPESEIKVSTQIFYILAMTCKGRALSIVQRVREGFGAEVWRMMCREFEPRLPSRFQGMLQSILTPAKSVSVEVVYNWEQKVRQYEEQSGDTISSTIKTSVLTTSLVDADLQRHLNLQVGRLTTYEAARKEAVDYLRTPM